MTVRIDNLLCVGCGLCEHSNPGLFRVHNDSAFLRFDPSAQEHNEIFIMNLKAAAEDCPVNAISIDVSAPEDPLKAV